MSVAWLTADGPHAGLLGCPVTPGIVRSRIAFGSVKNWLGANAIVP